MEQRDEELDAAQEVLRQGTPYIHPPEEREQLGGMCWINHNRVCGADCMAYDPEAPEGYEKCRVLGAAQMLIQLPPVKPASVALHPQIQEILRGSVPPKV